MPVPPALARPAGKGGSVRDPGVPSLLIVDDEADIRFLVRRIVEGAGGLRVAGEAASGEEAVARWRELRPDVVVLDQRMPGISGLETARRILAEDPAQRIFLFTAYRDSDTAQSAAEIGVTGCLSKMDLSRLIEEILAGAGTSGGSVAEADEKVPRLHQGFGTS